MNRRMAVAYTVTYDIIDYSGKPIRGATRRIEVEDAKDIKRKLYKLHPGAEKLKNIRYWRDSD